MVSRRRNDFEKEFAAASAGRAAIKAAVACVRFEDAVRRRGRLIVRGARVSRFAIARFTK